MSYTLAFALQLRKRHVKPSVRVAEENIVNWLIVFSYEYLKLVRIRTAYCALLRVRHELVQIG